MAPTNKAARVLTRKGLKAISIHKAIYFAPGEKDPKQIQELKKKIARENDPEIKKQLEKKLAILEDEDTSDRELTWSINPEGPASEADIIICDEVSMVGTRLGADLMSFGVPVIGLGDPGQLPPVKDTWFFPMNEPDFLLTEIHRQAADNPVIRLAHDIRNGRAIKPCTMGDQVVITHRGKVEMPESAEDMPQLIVGTHKTRWRYNDRIREHLDFRGLLPNEGEKLIVRKNSMNVPGMINGAEAKSVSMIEDDYLEHSVQATINMEGDDVECMVWSGPFRETRFGQAVRPRRKSPDWVQSLESERVDFAHAITCHLSQGSQWPHVLVVDESNVFRDDAARWLYTAATRTSDKLTILI